MAERRTPSRQTEQTRAAADRQTGQRRSTQERQTKPPVRRSDVIRCERCGEDYSITYKRCPFCDERPGRTGIGGRRAAKGRSQVHPIQLIALIGSMIFIIAALFIVFKYVGPLIFGEKDPGGSSSSAGTSQSGDISQPGSSSSGQPAGSTSSGGDVSEEPPVVNVTFLALDKSDITLRPDEDFQFTPSVSPANASITWTSSDPAILHVEQDGTVTNINSTGSKVKVTLTASAGDKTAECTIYCNGKGAGGTISQEPEEPTPSDPGTNPSGGGEVSSVPVSRGTLGTVVNAGGSGLNIRSGPGSSYDRVASAENGARVTILEDMRDGWYKIDYGNGKIGYVSSAYIDVD